MAGRRAPTIAPGRCRPAAAQGAGGGLEENGRDRLRQRYNPARGINNDLGDAFKKLNSDQWFVSAVIQATSGARMPSEGLISSAEADFETPSTS